MGLGRLHGVFHTTVTFAKIEKIKEGIDRVVMVDFAQFQHIPRILRYFWGRCEALVLDDGNLVILIPKDPRYHVVAQRSPWVREKTLDTMAAMVL